ncbi:hypothetical protein CMU19_04390 [Elizabethkingia anophelis]|nr:hypothetical protein [Elizabethkingia anophelis]
MKTVSLNPAITPVFSTYNQPKRDSSRYFFVSYNVRSKESTGEGNVCWIITKGRFFRKEEVVSNICKDTKFTPEQVVVTNFIEFNSRRDLNDFLKESNK